MFLDNEDKCMSFRSEMNKQKQRVLCWRGDATSCALEYAKSKMSCALGNFFHILVSFIPSLCFSPSVTCLHQPISHLALTNWISSSVLLEQVIPPQRKPVKAIPSNPLQTAINKKVPAMCYKLILEQDWNRFEDQIRTELSDIGRG